MKKIIALMLCLAMLLTLAACANDKSSPDDEEETKKPHTHKTSESSDEPTDEEISESIQEVDSHEGHVHISYRGVSHRFGLEEMEEIEGRSYDYTSYSGDTTLYIYNNVSFDGLFFTQIQYSFSETTTRVSCTYTADSELSEEEISAELTEVQENYRAILDGMYGEGNESETSGSLPTVSWHDPHGNYIFMMQLNANTLQVCFYLCAE